MIHNQHGFKPGDLVVLDATFNNHSSVRIKYISPRGMYAMVYLDGCSGDATWTVMTNRLTPIN